VPGADSLSAIGPQVMGFGGCSDKQHLALMQHRLSAFHYHCNNGNKVLTAFV